MLPDEEEIARERREERIQRTLLAAVIVMFIAAVIFVLLGLAIILWRTATHPPGSTTPESEITTYPIPPFDMNHLTESSIGTTTLSLAKTNRTSLIQKLTSHSLVKLTSNSIIVRRSRRRV